jgi:hypothetical protein
MIKPWTPLEYLPSSKLPGDQQRLGQHIEIVIECIVISAIDHKVPDGLIEKRQPYKVEKWMIHPVNAAKPDPTDNSGYPNTKTVQVYKSKLQSQENVLLV